MNVERDPSAEERDMDVITEALARTLADAARAEDGDKSIQTPYEIADWVDRRLEGDSSSRRLLIDKLMRQARREIPGLKGHGLALADVIGNLDRGKADLTTRRVLLSEMLLRVQHPGFDMPENIAGRLVEQDLYTENEARALLQLAKEWYGKNPPEPEYLI